MNVKKAKELRRIINIKFSHLNSNSKPTLREVYQEAKRKIKRGELSFATINTRTV